MAKLRCILHLKSITKESEQPFTEVRWSTFKACAKEWIKLDGTCKEIADKNEHLMELDFGDSRIPDDVGFHPTCYRRFIDRKQIALVQQRVVKQKEKPSPVVVPEKPDTGPSPKKLRSKTNFPTSTTSSSTSASSSKSKSKSVLPELCIICTKYERYYTDLKTRKRTKDRLCQAESTTAGSLFKAAEMKKDESILRHIRGQDCVAIEVRYHRRCYNEYTRFLQKSSAKQQSKLPSKYDDSYKVFCEEIIQKRIINDEEILRMTKLLQMFVNYVKECQGTDASTYTTKLLKQRLSKDYPQLLFHAPHKRNISEIVYVASLQTSSLFDKLPSSSETETSTTETESDASPKKNVPDRSSDITKDTDSRRLLYHSGCILLNVIKNVPSMSSLWPPTAECLTLESVKAMVPVILFNFLAWCTGASDEINITSFIELNNDLESKLLSICQDLIYLSHNGRKQTPKSLSLALTAKHLTGSARLLTILNRYGHCSSHDTVLSLETALAQLELQSESQIPKGFQKRSSTIMVWDNIDFKEETSSGHGTTHHTNGIMVQSEESKDTDARTLAISKTLRTFKPQSSTLETYVLHKKVGPQNIGISSALEKKNFEHSLVPPRTKDFAYILCKIVDDDVYSVPSWTGFNTVMQTDPLLSKSAINYLPVIPASPTEMGTVKTIFTRSIEIADRFELNHVMLVFDQAIYSKAQQIRWKDETLQKRTVIRMGEFHTCMSFCGVLGKRFRDAGLQDILIESGVIAQGSIETMLNGHHYNRSVRGHKLMFDALQELRFQSFMDSLSESDADNVKTVANNVWSAYPDTCLMDMLQSDEFQNLMQQYNDFIVERSKDNPTFALWSTYINMVQLLLLFIRATRESNWNLHLAAIRSMMPWFFAYDRMNYSRHLPAYWIEMINLPETHPECHSDVVKRGKWTVQRQESHGFASIACDQAIEQTLNRDSKTRGGIIGFTRNQGATQRWILSQPHRAAITRECEVMAGLLTDPKQKNVLDKNKIRKDTQAVKDIIGTIQSMINPFDNRTELVGLSTGTVASDDAKNDLLSAEEKGETALNDFMNNRLISQKVDIFTPIKAMKLKSFSDMKKQKSTKTKSGKELAVKNDRQFFGRLLIIAQNRNVNLKEVLSYSLGPVSFPLSNTDGSLAKTNKSALLDAIESEMKDIYVDNVPDNAALIIDGMALIQTLKNVQDTFAELSDSIFVQIIGLSNFYKCQRVDFVTDRYPAMSIKNIERSKRAVGGVQLMRIYGKDQKTPSQWKKYLSCGENKEELITFLFTSWMDVSLEKIGHDIEIYVTHGSDCHLLSLKNGVTSRTKIDALECDHEEADTRMLLHAQHASNTYNHVLIKSPDTDVSIISFGLQPVIDAKLYFLTGTKMKQRIIDVSKVISGMTHKMVLSLIALHIFTGCDTTSAFYGKGKKKAYNLVSNSEQFQNCFAELGSNFYNIDTEILKTLELFVCHLYGQNVNLVNDARYKMFCLNTSAENNLPPTQDALHQHILRVNYRSAIHRRSLSPFILAPSPHNHGWNLANDVLTLVWMTKDPAPDSILDCVSCNCKQGDCQSKKCSCKKGTLSCTDMCKCQNCANKTSSQTEEELCTPLWDNMDDSDTDSE